MNELRADDLIERREVGRSLTPLVWPWARRVHFVLSYGWAKIRLIYDVRRPRWAFFWFEWRYSIANLFNSLKPGARDQVYFDGHALVETRHETFEVRPRTQDAAIISPAFEHLDLRHLFRVTREAGRSQPVDFIDIGANIGQVSVRLGKRCPGVNLRTWAFEPVPQNFEILRRNLAANHVWPVKIFPVALSDHKGRMHMCFDERRSGNAALVGAASVRSISVRANVGDEVLGDLREDSARIIKIDVEGHELPVLRGLKNTLAGGVLTVICIEDIFDREAIDAELLAQGFRFDVKLTPYNSWYVKNATEVTA